MHPNINTIYLGFLIYVTNYPRGPVVPCTQHNTPYIAIVMYPLL